MSEIPASENTTIVMSQNAILEASRLQTQNPDFQGKDLRLYLEGKGCDGFFYGVTFDDATQSDHHFLQHSEDLSIKIDLLVDPDTLQFVEGCLIDWANDERGKGFIVNNPNQRAFRGKFFKRESWREKLLQGPAATAANQSH
jgi:iron-sulfur cluster insertion protein